MTPTPEAFRDRVAQAKVRREASKSDKTVCRECGATTRRPAQNGWRMGPICNLCADDARIH
jgi:ribosomal protein L40E